MHLPLINLINIILIIVVGMSIYTDLRDRKIYNVVVFPAMLAGLLLNFFSFGWEGLAFSLKGLGLGMVLLIIPFIYGGVGAGDVKLMGVIGSLTGIQFVFTAFLITGIVGGVMSFIFLVRQGRLRTTLKRIGLSLYIFACSMFRVNTLKTLDNADLHESIPYGLAIGIGTMLTYLVR